MTEEKIDGPAHYGGKANPYEAIKVIEAWGLGFCSGNAVKYILRAGRKPGVDPREDLQKAHWYLCHAKQSQDPINGGMLPNVDGIVLAHGLSPSQRAVLVEIQRGAYSAAARLVAEALESPP